SGAPAASSLARIDQDLFAAFRAACRSLACLPSRSLILRVRSCAHRTLCRSPRPIFISSSALRLRRSADEPGGPHVPSLAFARSECYPPGPPAGFSLLFLLTLLTLLQVRDRWPARRFACTRPRSPSGTPPGRRPAPGDGWPGWWSPQGR